MSSNLNSLLGMLVARGMIAAANGIMAKKVHPTDPIRKRIETIDERLKQLEQKPDSWARLPKQAIEQTREQVAVGCLPCARAHLATVAGTLKEALRFAREEGISHPEVQSRLQTAEEDITVIERHDWTPEKILKSPKPEQDAIKAFLPRLRELRQDIIQITTVDDLDRAAAKAGELATELRLEVMRLRGVDVGRVMELAKRVEAGELSMEEAKEELKSNEDRQSRGQL